MKNPFFAGMTSVLLLASCATSDSFRGLDADDDSRISRDEAARSSQLAIFFGSADGDQDGYLSSAEFERAGELMQALNGSHGDSPGGGHQH